MNYEPNSPSLRLLVADAYPLFRSSLRSVIDRSDDLELAGEADSMEATIDLCRSLRPDVAVVDLPATRGAGAGDAVTRIRAAHPRAGVLLMPNRGDEATMIAALRAGARGFATKDAAIDDALRAIRAVGRGDVYVTASMAAAVADVLRDAPSHAERAFPELTGREREVLALIAMPSSTGEAANRLGLSQKTVRNHMSSICNKLAVVDRAEAVLAAREAGVA